MEDILFKLPYASDSPAVFIQGTESLDDILAYDRKGWRIYLRQAVKTVTPYKNEDLPKSVKIVPKLSQPADILHLIGPVMTPALLLEARGCSARVVRVGGTTYAPRFSSYADGLRRAAMTLRGMGYDVYRLRERHGIPCLLVPDDRKEGDADTLIGFADETISRAACEVSRTTSDIVDTLIQRFNPRDLDRARSYIGMLEDALMTLQKRLQERHETA